MDNKEKIATLRKLFGVPAGKQFDPEVFLLKLGEQISKSNTILQEGVAKLQHISITDANEQSKGIERLTDLIGEMKTLQAELKQAIVDRKIERVEVETIREVPPSKFKIEVEQKDAPLPEPHRNFFTALFTGAVKAPIDGLTEWFGQALDFIRTPKGAIAVKLVDKNGDGFYTAFLNAISGGVNISLGSVESLLTTLTQRDTNTGAAGANTARVTIGYDTGWITTRANYSAAQTDTAIITASGAQRIVVKKVSVMADKANSVDVAARIGFGAANTPTGDGTLLSHPGIAAGSGAVEYEGESGVGAQTLGDDLRITSEVATGGSIDVIVVYKFGT